jgi:hypothetical protein
MATPEMRAKMDSMGVTGMAKGLEGIQATLGPGSMLRFTFARVNDAAELQAMSDREFVGEIAEGDSVRHVAYRIAGVSPMASTGISTFRASGKRWYIGFTNPDDQLGHMTALGMAALQALQP